MFFKHFFKGTKILVTRPLYTQIMAVILVVVLAFTLMVVSSYLYVSYIQNKQLRTNAQNAISYTEANIKSDMMELETLLGVVSGTIDDMIIKGESSESVNDYILFINTYIENGGNGRLYGATGIFGVFDVFGGMMLIGYERWIPPDDYYQTDRPWYTGAINAAGEISTTEPYLNAYSKKNTITLSRQIFDGDGNALGIVCLNIEMDRIMQYAVNTQLAENGYGYLLSSNLEIIAHPYPSFMGLRLENVPSRIATYKDELLENGHVSEAVTTDYRGIESIVFIQKLYNGWYMGIVAPRDKYYKPINDMAMMLIILGGLLAAILSIILIRIIIEKQKSDERTQLMFDAMPLCANFWDQNFNNIDCNQESVRLFEMSNKQEYNNRFLELSPKYQPDGSLSSEKGFEYLRKALEEGYCRFEWMHQKPDGEPIPAEITLVRVKYRKGYIIVGYTRDLRELKAMFEEIHRENEKTRTMAYWYESILNAISLPITVTDANTNWTFVNTAVEQFLNVKLEDILGKPCSNWGAHICNTEHCGIECAKRGQKRTYFSHKGSSYQVDVEVLKDLHGETSGYIEIVQDITNLEQMAKRQFEAESASIAKSAFLARVSHEIRTPMNAILGITEIQLQNEDLSPGMRESFSKIYDSGYLLLNIINDILDLSKIEAGKLELMPVNYDVASLINDTVHLNIVRYDSKPIKFNIQVDENIPSTLFGDELRIKQILNNLLSNAFKYTERGEVTLSANAERPPQGETASITFVFKVSDTGQGMSAEQVEKLFDEYTRFNVAANRTTVGTGLGMTITKHLVQMMSGEITVESVLGNGSVFTVRLPQGVVGADVLGAEVTENLQQFRLGKALQMEKAPQIVREYMPYGRVLVVDDVESNLYVVRGLLAPYGLSIETLSSGLEAIEKIKSGAMFDVIFMDHFMPKMDGIEAATIIRDMGYIRPIIALTANAIAGQAEIFLEHGFDGFISKPIDIRQLNAALNKFVRDRHPQGEVEAARRLKEELQKHTAGLTPQSGIDPQLAEIFARDAQKAAAALEAFYEKRNAYRDDDLKNFIINVHSMKSALANIGEAKLSDFAFMLEQAGREQNVAVLTHETPAFLTALRKLVKKLGPGKKEDDSGTADDDMDDESRDYLREKFIAIQAACAEYNKKTARDALAELRQKTWPAPIKELLNNISEHLLHSDFEEAANIAGDYVKTRDNPD